MKCSLDTSNFLEEISSLSHSIIFLYFFALHTEKGRLSYLLAILWNSAFRWMYLYLWVTFEQTSLLSCGKCSPHGLGNSSFLWCLLELARCWLDSILYLLPFSLRSSPNPCQCVTWPASIPLTHIVEAVCILSCRKIKSSACSVMSTSLWPYGL